MGMNIFQHFHFAVNCCLEHALTSILSVNQLLQRTVEFEDYFVEIMDCDPSLKLETAETQTCTGTESLQMLVHSNKQRLVYGIQGKAGIHSLISRQPLLLMAGDPGALTPFQIADRALVKESTIRRVLLELFKGWDKTFRKAQHQKNSEFESQLVEHIHFLLQEETKNTIKTEYTCKPSNVLRTQRKKIN